MVRILLILTLFVTACANVHSQKNRVNDKAKDYKENFTSYRPSYEVTKESKETLPAKENTAIVPKNDISIFLKEKLDSLYAYNQKITNAEGFRILIYTGTSSEEARQQKNNIYTVLTEDKAYTEWKSPYFKVKVGDYIDKLEAYYAYAKVIKVFPSAIVVPDKVNIIRE